jgi:hypothetical protein
MKTCPVCHSTYADDSLRFCLQDGATLESARSSSSDDFKTLVLPENSTGGADLPRTEILDDAAAGATLGRVQPADTSRHRPRDTKPVTEQMGQTGPKPRSTAAVVGLTIVATIALLALGGLTAWLLLRDKKDAPAPGDNQAAEANTARVLDNRNSAQPNMNTRSTANANATPLASPASSATPAPTPNASVEEAQVRAALNGWLSSLKMRDIDRYMGYYANVLEAYYLSRNTSVERVRADKERAFAKYSTIEVWLSDVRVQVNASGKRAVATFNKSYRFSGPGVNPFTGSGPNRFTWVKSSGGAWLITGEEDLTN